MSEYEDTSSSGEEKSTPPPDYTEKDPLNKLHNGSHGSLAGTSDTKHDTTIQQNKQTDSPILTKRRQPPAQDDGRMAYLKGMVNTGLLEEGNKGGQGGTTHTQPYSIDTDPLLQDGEGEGNQIFMGFIQGTIIGLLIRNKDVVWKVVTVIFIFGFTIYLGFAVAYSPYGAIAPLVVTGLVVLHTVYSFVKKHYGSRIYHGCVLPLSDWWDDHWHILRWFVYPAPVFGLIIYLSVMMTQVRQLQSLSGFVVFFFVLWLTSKHPDKVNWRPVIWGYSIQFLMGLLVLQWDKGYAAVEWLSDYVSKIINFGFRGGAVVWNDPFMILHPYVMMGMCLLIYVGAMMSILFYLGVTQAVTAKVAWAMSSLMGTTAIETMGTTANIMLNGMDVIQMMRPYLMKLTMSEFNCFMVGNNTTLAGFMFGLLILYGAPPQHLLTAAVMSAPASIAISKLNYPETVPEKSLTRDVNEIKLSRGPERSLFEASANGSAIAGRTVLTVLVNYISFMSLLEFLNAALAWFGDRVGYPYFSFGWICSYLFFPIALLIGVDVNQCKHIAECIGLKIFTTEIYAYQVLGQMYEDGIIDDRSKALGTYALCGFCSMSTLAIAIGIWYVLCPQRRPLVTRLMFRVMFQANMACFTTACVAGLFYSEKLAIFEASERTPIQKIITFLLGGIPKIFS